MKLPRWKKEQKEKKSRQLKSRFRFFLVTVIFLGAIVLGFFLLKIYTVSVLPKNGRTTVIFENSPFKVLTFDQDGKVTFLQVPANLYLEATHGYGSYKLGSLSALGKLEKRNGGFLAESIQEFLGVPVDGWVGKEKTETNLSFWDRFRVWWKIKNTKASLIQTINLQDTGILTKYFLPDHSEGLTVDFVKLDKELDGVFHDSGIVAEHLTTEVLNGSNKPEMANRTARLINNFGGRVISLGNSEKESNTCQLKGSPLALKSLTGQRLKKIFNCREVLWKVSESRADLQLTVGLDYWQKLNQK